MNTAFENLIDDSADENDVDRLFAHLEQCEPPVDMVERIMAAVACLPLPQVHQALPWQDLEILIVDEEGISIN
jgi:hypothetical protein